jgi:hypothetical protein
MVIIYVGAYFPTWRTTSWLSQCPSPNMSFADVIFVLGQLEAK